MGDHKQSWKDHDDGWFGVRGMAASREGEAQTTGGPAHVRRMKNLSSSIVNQGDSHLASHLGLRPVEPLRNAPAVIHPLTGHLIAMSFAALLLVPLLIASPADRAQVGPVHVQLRLAPGPSAVLTFRLQPGWHLYWKDSGDSGLPPEVQWTLPPGWVAGPLEHPLPQAFADAAGVAYGHAGTVHLVARFQGPGLPKGTFQADVEWLACKEGCVPGKASLQVDAGRASHWLSRGPAAEILGGLPGPPPPSLQVGPGTFARTQEGWVVRVPLQGPSTALATRFFPETPEGFTVRHAEVRLASGTLTIPLVPGSSRSRLSMLKGVLALGRKGVALEIPLSAQEAP